MNEDQRQRFAALMKDALYDRYDGFHNRFYGDVRLNPQTLTNVLEGRSVKPATITTLCKKLYPATAGDWTRLDLFGGDVSTNPEHAVGGPDHASGHGDFVRAPGEQQPAGVTDSEVLREIRAMREELRTLSERLADVEQHRDA